MAKTKKQRLSHLKQVLMIQTKSRGQERMVEFIKNQIEELDDRTITMYEDEGNIYITKGKAKTYPCVVAHMDTVHSIVENFHIYEHGDALFSFDHDTYSQVGIGGDDKVGIFCCLESLERFDTIKIAFFKDEEIGCVGSRSADMDFFKNVSFVLQADRKGYKDFVRKIAGNLLYSDDFAEIINPVLEKYNKEECMLGGSTDVGALHTKGIGVCVANSSCGYYNPHRDGEYVIISEVFKTSDLFRDIILEAYEDGKTWVMPKYSPPVRHLPHNTNRNFASAGRSYPSQLDWWRRDFDNEDVFHFLEELQGNSRVDMDVICPECKTKITDMYDDTEDGYYCVDCNGYRYLPNSKWGLKEDTPSSNMISNMISDRRRNRNKRRRNRK